ncbi:MAG: 2-phosphosulfolactate phosphatase [Candidatus Kapaibacteriota bacterium]
MNINFNIIDTPKHYLDFLQNSEKSINETNSSFNIYLYIDILRATSTILTMLSNEVAEISVFATKELAFDKYNLLNNIEKLYLCGEENSIKPNGFFGGNSPFDYIDNDEIKNSHILFTSSNGAKIIANDTKQGNYFDLLENSNCQRYILSFLNFTVLINKLKEFIFAQNKLNNYTELNINLVCGGENNNISVEDTVCAIYFTQILTSNLLIHNNHEVLNNFSQDISILFNEIQELNINGKLNEKIFWVIRNKSTHIQRLKDLNYDKDIGFCLQFDKINLIARVVENKIFKI